MKKNTYLCVDLKTVLQHDALLKKGQCYRGLLTCNSNEHFRFEETISKGRPARNPKLFDGKYISMVRMQNGRYQCHLKTMRPDIDREKFAFAVYYELSNALKIIE